MKRFYVVGWIVIFIVACATATIYTLGGHTATGVAQREIATPELTNADIHLISASGIGRLRLDMTLDEARRALPMADFERDSDGDGAALVRVTLAADTFITLSADEDDANDPIDWPRRITYISTSSSSFHTVEGVRAGDRVTDVERIYGKTKQIEQSEIESREYIQFEMQPPYLSFRLDYTGVFPAGTRVTRQFKPDAKILFDRGVDAHPGDQALHRRKAKALQNRVRLPERFGCDAVAG